MNRPHMVVR